MIRNIKRSGRLCRVLVILASLILVLAGLSAAKTDVAEAHISEKGRIQLILHALTKAINDPDIFNLDIISSAIPREDRDLAREKIQHFSDTKHQFAGLFDFEVNQQVTLSQDELQETGNSLVLSANLFFRANGVVNKGSVTIRFTKERLKKITNTIELLDNINSFIDESHDQAKLYITEEGTFSTTVPTTRFDHYSENMLGWKPFYSGSRGVMDEFNAEESNELLGCLLISRPFDMVAVVISDPPYTDSGYVIYTDPNWNRIIGSNDSTQGQWLVQGYYGSGDYNFKQPYGITFAPPDYFIIADAYNHRAIVLYHISSHEDSLYLHYFREFKNDYNTVLDVAAAYMPEEDRIEIGVLDWSNSRVDVYPDAFTTYDNNVVLFEGSGNNQVRNPSSICYARSPISGYHMPYIYAADAGNDRIIRVSTSDIPDFQETSYTFPEDAYLGSIDVDYFGYVYVLDTYNSTVYLFDPDLQTLIATFGSKGYGHNRFFYPNRLKIAEGWDYDDDLSCWMPITVGDATVTQQLTDSAGLKRFDLEFDILGQELTFIPREGAYSPDWFHFQWSQSGVTKSIRYIYHEDTLLRCDTSDLDLPGQNCQSYSVCPDSTEEGNYVFKVEATSIYDPSHDTTFCDTIYVDKEYCSYVYTDWVETYHMFSGYYAYSYEEAHDVLEVFRGRYLILQNGKNYLVKSGIGGGRRNIHRTNTFTLKNIDAILNNHEGFDQLLLNDRYLRNGIIFNLLNGCADVLFTNSYIDDEDSQTANSVNSTSDGGYIITGGISHDPDIWYDYDLLLKKTDSIGRTVWTKRYWLSDHQEGRSVQQTQDGGFIVVGDIFNYYDDRFDLLLLKTNSSGDMVWSKTFGDTIYDANGYDVMQTSDLGYIIAGQKKYNVSYIVKTDVDGNILWEHSESDSWQFYSVDTALDGGYVFAGGKSNRLHLLGLQTNGNYAWHKNITFPYGTRGRAIQRTVDGGFIVLCDLVSCLVKINSCGDTIWTKVFSRIENPGDDPPDSLTVGPNAVVQTSDGGFLVVGRGLCFRRTK